MTASEKKGNSCISSIQTQKKHQSNIDDTS